MHHKRKRHYNDSRDNSSSSSNDSISDSDHKTKKKRKQRTAKHKDSIVHEARKLLKAIRHDEKQQKGKFGSGKKQKKKELKGRAATKNCQANNLPQKKKNSLKKN